MDLYDHYRGQATANKRNQAREQFNQQLDVLNRQAASQAASAEEMARQTGIQKEEQEAIKGAFAAKGGIQDFSAALKGAGKGTAEAVAKDVLEAAKSGKSMVEAGSKATDKALGKGTSEKLAKGVEKSGLGKKASATFGKVAETKVGKTLGEAGSKAMAHTGALVNIGLGAYDLSEDFKGGHFQLKGDNDAEKVSNALQIGSGVADAIGFVFPPAFVLGAALGVASSGAELVGAGQQAEEESGDIEKAEKKQEAQTSSRALAETQDVVEQTTTLASA